MKAFVGPLLTCSALPWREQRALLCQLYPQLLDRVGLALVDPGLGLQRRQVLLLRLLQVRLARRRPSQGGDEFEMVGGVAR